MVITAVWPLQMLGREFMPELEEGNLWIRGIFPVNENLDAVQDGVKRFREVVMHTDYTDHRRQPSRTCPMPAGSMTARK